MPVLSWTGEYYPVTRNSAASFLFLPFGIAREEQLYDTHREYMKGMVMATFESLTCRLQVIEKR
ncbi:hypothetical protein PDUR_14320 [Paenibacillus durus]|uniref:Uncharacterized protein n=1 Tax=Paenibacillus durus TaxID=44251 RepID=A0A089HLZ2_PAEDU|nr:hypothetical protein PDUR_14320 [Paenibacillus durus]